MNPNLIALALLIASTSTPISFKAIPEMEDDEAKRLAAGIFDRETRAFLYINETDSGLALHKQPLNGSVETMQFVEDAIEVRFGRTANAISILTVQIPAKMVEKYGEDKVDQTWKAFARMFPMWNTMRISQAGKQFDPMKVGRLDKMIRGGELPEGFIRKVVATIDSVHFFDIEADWLKCDAIDMAMSFNDRGEPVLNVATPNGVYYRNLDFRIRGIERKHMFEIGNTTSIVPGFDGKLLAAVDGKLLLSKPDDWKKAKVIPSLEGKQVIRVAKKHDLVVIQTIEDGILAKRYAQLLDADSAWMPYIDKNVIEETGVDQPLELVGSYGRDFLATAPTTDGTLAARRFEAPKAPIAAHG